MNEGYNLESISRGRNNNLNLIRFIAALMVIHMWQQQREKNMNLCAS